jgi:hypothetical protein
MTLETKCQNIAHRRFSEAKTYGNRPLETCPFCRIEGLESSIKTLGRSIRSAAIGAGIVSEEHSLTGPQLLLLLSDMCDFINDLKSQKGKQLEAKDVEIAALEGERDRFHKSWACSMEELKEISEHADSLQAQLDEINNGWE